MNFSLTEQVFMKEAERQILQDTLHKEVIRKIILLQSWLRMVLERRRFLRMRQAAVVLQVSMRTTITGVILTGVIFLTTNKQTNKPCHGALPTLRQPSLSSDVPLQACWRSRRVRLALQRNNAAIELQAAWRRHRQRKRFLQLRRRICLLQALVRGHLQRKR